MPGDLSKSIRLNTGGVKQVASMYARAEWYRSRNERVRFVRLWSLLSFNLTLPPFSLLSPLPLALRDTCDRYILRSVEPFVLFHPTAASTQWRATLPRPIVGEHRNKEVVNELPFVPSMAHASAVRWGIQLYTRLRTSSFHNSTYRPDRSLLSLRADKRERPEPWWPLDVSALYTRYVQYVAT